MNPLVQVRSAASRIRSETSAAATRIGGAPRRAWEGTTRTAGWVGDGIDRGWDRSGGARLAAGARSNPRIAIAWAVGALLLIAWVAWTAYVTAEHGANAGLGVLLSWPAVFAALALVAAPFLGTYLLVRRLRGDDQSPPIAGGAEVPASDSDAMTGGTYPG